jgi:fibronectin type 3 domain-containing protein
LNVPVGDWSGKGVTFKVRSQGIRGRWSQWSNEVTLAVAAPVAAPSLRAMATVAGVELEWDGKAGDSYLIKRTSAGSPAPIMLGPVSGSTFLDKDAQFNQTYSYRVQSTGSPMSAPVEITPKDTFPPATPTGLTAISGTGSAQLSWNPVEDADLAGYQVYRAEGEGSFIRIGGRLTAPSFQDREVKPAVTYRYRVSALDAGGNESPPSEASTVMVP